MNRAFAKSRAEDGFTLIELLIVIVIIGILAAIAIPVFLNQQKAAINATVKSDVRNTTANVLLAINKVPTATGFVVYGPGDTLATTKMAGVPSSVITVPAGQVGVEATRSRNNIIVINGSVSAGYEVIGCNPDTKFGWKFISNTGLFADAPNCAAIITAASAPAMNTPVTITTGDGGSAILYSKHLSANGLPSGAYVCIALMTEGTDVRYPYYFQGGISVSGQFSAAPGLHWFGSPAYGSPVTLPDGSGMPFNCEHHLGAIAYSYALLYPNTNTGGNGPISKLRMSYGYGTGPEVPFDPNNWVPTLLTP